MEGIDYGQLLKSIIGQSDRQVLDRESDRYRGPGTKVERKGIEKLTDLIFRGGSSAGLQRLSEEDYVDSLKENYGGRLEAIDPTVRTRLGLGGRESITKDVSDATLLRQIKSGEALEDAITTAKGTRGIKPEDYAGTDTATIRQNTETAALNQGRRDLLTDPLFEQQQRRYVDAQNLQTAMLSNQMTQQANQFALAQDQLALQMRREDRALARDERKDRQAMIMMLMKGLGQMGQGFAI